MTLSVSLTLLLIFICVATTSMFVCTYVRTHVRTHARTYVRAYVCMSWYSRLESYKNTKTSFSYGYLTNIQDETDDDYLRFHLSLYILPR